jgi:SAM-dependent methyltransferase
VATNSRLIARGGAVLDVAAGSGRHTQFLHARGHPVVAVDRDVTGLATRAADWREGPVVEILTADLEDGSPWALGNRRFAGVVVTNYLHRPLMPLLAGALLPGGVLIYETFAQGNERFGKPSNPAFLLIPGELLAVAQNHGLTVLEYFSGEVRQPKPAMIQRIVARAPY